MSNLGEPEGIASLSLESGLRKVWSVHDTTVIEAKFKSLPKFPGKNQVLNIFNNDQVLSYILQREGAVRCYKKWPLAFRCRSIKLLLLKSASSQDEGYLPTDIWLKSSCGEDEGDADCLTTKHQKFLSTVAFLQLCFQWKTKRTKKRLRFLIEFSQAELFLVNRIVWYQHLIKVLFIVNRNCT